MRADLLISNARVFAPGAPPASTIAITGGRITAVGIDRAEVTATEEIDAGGGLVTPGFIDAHVHPVLAGTILTSCDLNAVNTIDDYRDVIAAYAEDGDGWITGGGWAFEAFPGGIPTLDLLDDVTRGRPAYLTVKDGHAGWANSEALRLAGIDSGRADPPDGRIERFEDGRPNGCLQEGAMTLVERVIPPAGPEDMLAALHAGQDYLIRLGITGWQDAWVDEVVQRTYLAADAAGTLLAKVRGALWWERDQGMEQVSMLLERREHRSPHFDPGAVKIMLDGVCENFTASMLAPYLDAQGRTTDNLGLDFIDPGALPAYVGRLHQEEFQVHFHALGDRAVRNALDALDAANATHGQKDLRHHLAHIQVIDPADLPRFRSIGAVANAQPLWALHEEAMDVLTIPFLGPERSAQQYPFRSLLEAGATLAMGSDWSVSSPDPLAGIEVATRRTHPDISDEPFLPDEAIDLATALTAYTHGAAFVNHADDSAGTIASGKDADLAILSGDPFVDGHPAQHNVTHTIIDGKVVFRNTP